ncbi:hypothetical protein ABZP36_001973 [Zizania latifolia]
MRYIEDDRDRSITLSKRRDGMFKIASDLSILTGASIAIILDGKSKVQFFGAPLVEPIIDTFMSEYPSMESLADEQLKAKIEQMQSEVLQLERENAEKDKRLKESIRRFKEAQEESLGMAKHIFSRPVDLSLDEIRELLHALSPIQQDIQHRLPPLHRGKKPQISGSSPWALQQPSYSHLVASHNPMLPRETSGIAMIPPPPAPGSPWSHLFPLQTPQFPYPQVPSIQVQPVLSPQNTVAPPQMHAPLVQQLPNQGQVIPQMMQLQMPLGDQPTSEVQAYNPVEQPQNHSADYIPNFGDNYISDFLADISEDSSAAVDPLVSPLVDDQWFDNYLFADLDTTDGNLGQVVSGYGVPQAPGVPAGAFFDTLPGSSFGGENANAGAGY